MSDRHRRDPSSLQSILRIWSLVIFFIKLSSWARTAFKPPNDNNMCLPSPELEEHSPGKFLNLSNKIKMRNFEKNIHPLE